jgi:phage FluMu protein gp41
MSEKLSGLSERQLYALRTRLAAGVQDPARTLRGALVSDMRRCSSERCRCRSDELHGPYSYLTVYSSGRSRMVYVPKVMAAVAADHVEATRQGEALLLEISQVNLELLRRRLLR